ncbi:hypothetical protein OOJ91_12310 [Micromonospora lupini]|uniref:hypothetical protein n=1 Tax=Micromonospora lupini TaxID=285679 RepID=UPI00225B8519|nr:hypothetical protein [Micromonospora lupini]MCX5066662.1 hypothetical protein [Micromonospora lupini]
MGTYVDAERAVAGWINSLTGSLVGPGRPLLKGAHLTALRGAASSCYALLSLLPGSVALGVENPDHRARVSASIYGPTKEAATTAAIAYANALLTLDGRRQPMTGAVCLVVDPDSISGPAWLPDQAGPRLLVDADFYLRAA